MVIILKKSVKRINPLAIKTVVIIILFFNDFLYYAKSCSNNLKNTYVVDYV